MTEKKIPKKTNETNPFILPQDENSLRKEKEFFLNHYTGKSKGFRLAHPEFVPDRETQEKIDIALERRKKGEPIAYILGFADFFKERYCVSPACLIPRQETELLVEKAIQLLPPHAYFADFCTGSGCIAISVLANRPDCRAWAVDFSKDALKIAKKNAEQNNVSNRIEFFHADLLNDCLPEQNFDMILSNPPYITEKEMQLLSQEVLAEPHMALCGGEDGLVFYRTILQKHTHLLKKNGRLLFEIGFQQAQSVQKILSDNGWDSIVYKDYSENDRCIEGFRN